MGTCASRTITRGAESPCHEWNSSACRLSHKWGLAHRSAARNGSSRGGAGRGGRADQGPKIGLIAQGGEVGVGGGGGGVEADGQGAAEQGDGSLRVSGRMGLGVEQGHRAGGIVKPVGAGDALEAVDVGLGGGIAKTGSDQGAKLESVGEVRLGVQGDVEVLQGHPRVGLAEQVGQAEMRPGMGRVVGQDAPEVVEGAVGVVVETRETPGNPCDEVVGLSSQGVGEVALGLVVTAEPVQGLGAGGQGGGVAMSQGDRVVEIGQGGGRVAELEADQGPVETGRDEVGVSGQGPIIGVAGLGQPVGRRQGQATVQVRPGKFGRRIVQTLKSCAATS